MSRVSHTWVSHWDGTRNELLDPDPDSIKIHHIAHTLAQKSHWNGRCKPYFSVAQHCCMVHDHLPPELQKGGLLHDSAEAYLCDVPSPLKALLDRYREIEDIWNNVINRKFGIEIDDPRIKVVDSQVLYLECIHVMAGANPDDVCAGRNLTDEQKEEAEGWGFEAWDMQKSEKEFLRRYIYLTMDVKVLERFQDLSASLRNP